tara:strand:- start:18 stop:257 length:240 start_codon:yes stop_codon:yes gene_type:complete
MEITKTRKFYAQATMSIDMEQTFELTEAEYQQVIEDYGDLWNYARDEISVNGEFTEVPNSGDWNMYDVSEITNEESTND